jgi:hypothetical protein
VTAKDTVRVAPPALRSLSEDPLDPADAHARRRSLPHSSLVVGGLLVIALVPFAVAVIAGARTHWTPSGDQALLVLRMHDVGGAHTPTTGAYSRFGWNHPGPLELWVGAAALRLFGTSGVLATMAIVNTAWVVVAVGAARRLAGDAFAGIIAVGICVLVHTHGAVKLIDPWNPWVAMLPILAFVCSVAAFAQTGRRWTILAAVAAGSYAVQSHLGPAPVVAGGAVAAAIWFWTVRPPVIRPRRLALTLLLEILALWSGPIVDQVSGSGNAHSILRFVLHPAETRVATAGALGVAARELGLRPAWTGSPEAGFLQQVLPAPTWLLVVPALVLLALGWVAWRRRDRLTLTLTAFALVMVLTSVVAITRTVGLILLYLLRWTWPISLFALAAAVWGLWRSIAPRLPNRALAIAGIALGAVVAVSASAASVGDLAAGPMLPDPSTDRAAAHIVHIVETSLPKGRYRPVLLDPLSFSAAGTGTTAQLERDGWDIQFPATDAFVVGAWRTARGRPAPQLIVVGRTARADWTPPTGAKLIGRWDPLSKAERAHLLSLSDAVFRAVDQPEAKRTPADLSGAIGRLRFAGRERVLVDRTLGLLIDAESYEVWVAPPAA